MAGYHTANVGNLVFQRGRPPTPIVNIALVLPKGPAKRKVVSTAHKPGDTPSPDLVEKIRSLRATGASLHEIARECGVSHTTVCRRTKDILPPDNGWKSGAHASRFSLGKIQRMRRAGFTYREIADDVGAAQGTIWNLLNERTPENRRGGRGRTHRMLQVVRRITGVQQDEIRNQKTERPVRSSFRVSRARHIVFWILVKRHSLSYPRAGLTLRGFDHTSVLHGVRRVEEVMRRQSINPDVSTERLIAALWAADWSHRKAA